MINNPTPVSFLAVFALSAAYTVFLLFRLTDNRTRLIKLNQELDLVARIDRTNWPDQPAEPRCHSGAANTALHPPPLAPAPVFLPSCSPPSFHTVSLAHVPALCSRRVPPTATTCGELAG